uniref:Uncharacterized protein n=1 Tax=Candidatus Kentrum sp. LFY TaxID=2126342 RepID=A0A450UCY9_9GAMM|nr:MAG: hypothetical protein BECKLFY1418B_GA0070995_10199 [Candidatus Kentron sp. LFY]
MSSMPGMIPLLPNTELAPHMPKNDFIERLVQFQYIDEGVMSIDKAPIQLTLRNGVPRNWEGIVSLDKCGFLLVTDSFPASMLAFVAAP